METSLLIGATKAAEAGENTTESQREAKRHTPAINKAGNLQSKLSNTYYNNKEQSIMEQKLIHHIDTVFAPYSNIAEVKEELTQHLLEKYRELISEGKDANKAYQETVDSIGDVSDLIDSQTPSIPTTIDFSATDLRDSDLAGTTISQGNFKTSALQNSNFRNASLTNATFYASDVHGSDFQNADLTNATFKVTDAHGSNFSHANLTNVQMDKSDVKGSDFTKANLTNTRLKMVNLGDVNFEGANLTNTDFSNSDIRGVSFEGQTLVGAIFNNMSKKGLKGTSFKNATLRSVSFHHSDAKEATFDGATVDKLTYASLKGTRADLSNVTII